MAEKLRLVYKDENGKLKEWFSCEKEPKGERLARVELEGDGRDRLVFYTDPERSHFVCRVDGVHVDAWINCEFRNLVLNVVYDWKNQRLTTLKIGPYLFPSSFETQWRKGDLTKKPVEVVKSHSPHTGKLLDAQAKKLEIEGSPALKALFVKLADENSWTPAFYSHCRIASGSTLKAFGVQGRFQGGFPSQVVQLVQIPESVFRPQSERSLPQKWFVGVRGLPYEWGRDVWNSLLAEQVRAGDLDIPHASLFSPLLHKSDNPSRLGWHFLLEVREEEQEPGRYVSLGLSLRAWDSAEPVAAELPLLRDHLGKGVEAEFLIDKVDQFKQGTELDLSHIRFLREQFESPGLALGIPAQTVTSRRDSVVRIGSLDIHLARARKGGNPSQMRWRLDLDPTDKVASTDKDVQRGAYRIKEAQVDLDWPIERITPGGQDDITGEFYADCDSKREIAEHEKKEHELECKQKRERPLVVPLSKNDTPGIVLHVQERARQGDVRRMALTLRRTDGAGGPGDELKELAVCSPDSEPKLDRVAVLDREPFLVAKVSFPKLGSLQDPASGNEIANWRSYGADAGAWHIRFPDAQNFCLTLPPQGVGETMEKRIKDDQGLPEGELADFRLSPPAFLAMRERYYQQNFPEAPWNLRRLLSDPERELPGAQVEHLQYELLYGLSCRIDYPFMRLAEISALVGDVMEPLPQRPAWVPVEKQGRLTVPKKEASDRYFEARQRWIDFAKCTRQRLGIFELWDIRKLDTLELKEGVTCWIRHQIRKDKVPTKSVADLVTVPTAEIADPFQPQDGDFNKDKLRGGVTWGFESQNVYEAVVREETKKWPQSNSAEMKETRLSALGGWGHQTAAFDNFRTKILADVAMGRTYSYTLERIGRIGCWWNRAKHVIVYERTVVRSRLFGTSETPPADAQNPHEGRAVLRKVDEYVEILQNRRKYPDQGKGDAKATGCITECCFSEDPNQVIRFRVRGSWGTDVGKEGWKIPIWRRGEEPADLFPEPKVDLWVMASIDGKSVPAKVTCANPENMFFYTDTTVPPEALDNPSVDLSNTDAWSPVESVDFVDQACPRPCPDPAFASGSLRQSSPGDTVIPVGFGPCTFLIEPAEHTVDLLANRKGDPMGSLLSSVTMSRASFQATQPGLSTVVETARNYVVETVQRHLDSLPADARRFNPDDLKKDLESLCGKVGDEIGGRLAGPAARLEEGNTRLQQIGKTIDKLVEQIDQQATEKIAMEAQRLAAYPTRLVEELKAEKGKLKDALRREMELAKAQMKLTPSPAAYLASVEAALRDAESQLREAQSQIQRIDNSLDTWIAAARLPELVQKLRTYRSTLRSISQRIRAFADSAALKNRDDKVALGIGPQWVAKNVNLAKVAECVQAVEATLASVEQLAAGSDAVKTVASKRLRKVSEQAAVLQEVLDQARDHLKKAQDGLQEAKTQWHGLLDQFTENVLTEIGSAIDVLDPSAMVEGLRRKWEEKVQSEAKALNSSLNTAMTAVRTKTSELFKGLKIEEDLIPTRDRVAAAVTTQCGALKEQFEKLLTDIGADLGIEEKLTEVRSFLERQRDEALRQIDEELGGGIKAARQLLGVVEAKKDDVLKLVRAFGKPPDVSGLQFDRPEVAFFYNELQDRVDVTPVIARAAQAAAIVDALKPFGVDLPVKQLGEQLIPEELKNFNVSSILPNIAGIPLKDLFSGLKMPGGSGDAVKVRHGLDPQTRRAWVNTEINFQSSENATLFAVGPLAVRVNQPRFQAEARMEADLQKIRKKKVSGELRGDWLLQIGGFPLITFKQTPLTFDDAGRINFQVNPKDVVLAPALDFINELMTTISPGGLTTRFDGDGVVSTLDLPIPDTQIGAFGFSGLRLCASMALRYSNDFSIGVTAGLARRDAPFTLTIFILGGAGYLELGSRYVPATGKVYATADMAIAVSASLAIALGPIRGGVAVYIGVTANYDSQRGGGLVVGLMFMVRGHVSVLSIASATITLRLDGQYQNGAMVGTGHLEIKIKICWCFTLEVSESVTYTLGRVGSSKQRQTWLGGPQPVEQLASLQGIAGTGAAAEPKDKINPRLLWMAVEDYLDMLE